MTSDTTVEVGSPITIEQATEQGLRPLAGPYTEAEGWMIENVLLDMRRGVIDHAVVTTEHGPEVWRSNYGWRGVSK